MKIHFPPPQEKQLSAEQDFEKFLNFLPDAVVAVKPDGRIILVNNQTERLFGFSREELSGQKMEILLPECFRIIHEKHRSTYFKYPKVRGMGTGLELSGRKKDGSEFPVEISLSPFETDEGIIAISAIRDITDRKKAEERQKKAQQKIEELLNFTPDSIVVINKKGDILFVNNQTEKLFGYNKQELIGSALGVLLPERFRVVHKGHQMNYFSSPRVREMGLGLELFAMKKDGSEFPVEISLSPFETDEGTVAISAIRDISERKSIEAERKKDQLMLEEHALQLEAVNKELEAFSYSVSHDLRAPLRAVNGYARILEEDYGAALDKEAHRLIQVIKNNAIKMGILIDDLLIFSRLGRKQLQVGHINVKEIVEDVIIEVSRSSYPNAQIICGTLYPAYGDKMLVTQVFINLISNALKYSSKIEKPVVEVNSILENNKVIFSVKDNGAGYNMEYAGKLFGVFQRLHSEDEFEGTGVGLAIVKRIVTKHGGNVWAEGIPGKGATFYFSLPFG